MDGFEQHHQATTVTTSTTTTTTTSTTTTTTTARRGAGAALTEAATARDDGPNPVARGRGLEQRSKMSEKNQPEEIKNSSTTNGRCHSARGKMFRPTLDKETFENFEKIGLTR